MIRRSRLASQVVRVDAVAELRAPHHATMSLDGANSSHDSGSAGVDLRLIIVRRTPPHSLLLLTERALHDRI